MTRSPRGAPSAAISVLGTVLPPASAERSSRPLARGFRLARLAAVQPLKAEPSYWSPDSDPRPPECPADEAGPAGAAPCSTNWRHRLTPLVEQGGVDVWEYS